MIIDIVLILAIIIAFIYQYLILRFYLALGKKRELNLDYTQSISIIIAFRNEEKNLTRLLASLKKLSYPIPNYEIIFVNDESTDNSVSMVSDFIKETEQAFLIHSKGGKKKALFEGINFAHYPIVACTDADCEVHKNWLQSIAGAFLKNDKHITLGPVFFIENGKTLSALFALEFSSLLASTAGSTLLGNAVMANGANLSFRKSSYLSVSQHLINSRFASGDDTFLLGEIKKKYGNNSVEFLYNKDAVIQTNAPESLLSFYYQRIRWASKSHKLNNLFATFLAFAVLSINTIILICFGFGFLWFSKKLIALSILVFIIKAVVDFLLLYRFLSDFGKVNLLRNFVLVQLFYPLYVVSVALATVFVKVSWKGRSIKS